MGAITEVSNSSEVKPIYILGFLDRLIQRIQKVINLSWIIPNPHGLTFNIAHEIDFKRVADLETIQDPKIIRSETTPEDRARKIIEIGQELLNARKQNEPDSNSNKAPKISLDLCIQHVCSYAFNFWMLDSTKKKITQEIERQLKLPATKQDSQTPVSSSTDENTVNTEPHLISSNPQTRSRSASEPAILNSTENKAHSTEPSTEPNSSNKRQHKNTKHTKRKPIKFEKAG